MKYVVFIALTFLSIFAHSEWIVDTESSHVGFASVKNKTIAENHRLSGLTGSVSGDGAALVKIDIRRYQLSLSNNSNKTGYGAN